MALFNRAFVLVSWSETPRIFFTAANPPTVAAMPFSLLQRPSAAVVPSLIRLLKRSCWLPAFRIFSSMESKAAPALASSSRASRMAEVSTELPEARCMASKLFSTMFIALCMDFSGAVTPSYRAIAVLMVANRGSPSFHSRGPGPTVTFCGPGAVSVQFLSVSSFPAPPEYQWPQ